MNNLIEKEIEFKFDESFFDESLDERMKVLTKDFLMKILTKKMIFLTNEFVFYIAHLIM